MTSKQKYLKIFITVFIIVFSVLFFYQFNLNFAATADLSDAFTGDNYLDKAAGSYGAGYDTGVFTVEPIIASIIQTALSFLGVVFLILMIYGGYLWMTARGNEEQTTKAKNTITAAIIGIVIVLSAYAISYLVIKKLGDKALESSPVAETP